MTILPWVAGAVALVTVLLVIASLSDKGREILVWMRDQFAGWFASFWLYIIAWSIVAGAFSILLYMDGKFSRGLAEGASIDPLAFQAMGWVFRFFALIFLMASARAKILGLGSGKVWRRMGIACSIIVFAHAVGIGLQAMDQRKTQALATLEQHEVNATSNADLIAALTQQKGDIERRLKERVDPIEQKIIIIQTDGDGTNDGQDVPLEARKQALQDKADAAIDDIDAQILALMASGTEARTEAIAAEADSKPYASLFVGMAQLFTWTKEPSLWAMYICGVGFIIFWVGFAESIVIFLPKEIYAMHMHDAANSTRTKTRHSDRVPDGMVDLRMTEEEWAAYEDAKAEKERRMKGAKNAKPPVDFIKIGNKEWVEEMRQRIIAADDDGLAPDDIAKAVGLSWPEYTMIVSRLFRGKRAAELLGQAVNGTDTTGESDPIEGAENGNEDESERSATS